MRDHVLTIPDGFRREIRETEETSWSYVQLAALVLRVLAPCRRAN
ncbi:hypothetical protein SNOG_02394 [Parastagonospora nodorum SN15]|uniref:Uncharacterized protein n=1 Tax=Phaeosphaeria nodorum (strain SN15 / ATCC MYA-4574 / FGSC 10173) TaxID=321614 RepID=Q0V0S0_PHANO|nr:hypothetical protein SNOG_02394 [Parastagonospora nodorum SN15]EAT90606.1 hypothetical protein SNOG_02394 [Parastagonospora nodorum SN15]